jgi:histidyl-tRNA synthetase
MALGRLKLGQFTIKLNDRRLLSALARSLGVEGEAARALFRSIDKLEKIGTAGVRAELRERGITDRTADALFRFLELTGSDEAEKLTRAGQYFDDDPGVRAGVDSLLAIGSCLAASGVPAERFTYDFSMVRGLDYYTGPIFETFVEEPRIGSISSGGRYDGLIGLFVGRDVPATGGSLGLERIIDVVEELQLQPTALAGTVTEVLVTIFAAELTADSLGLARDLRAAGVRTEVVLTGDRLPNQLRYAGRRKVPFVTIVGPDEVNAGNVLVRDMVTGQQEAVPRAAAAAELRRRLDAAAATIRT